MFATLGQWIDKFGTGHLMENLEGRLEIPLLLLLLGAEWRRSLILPPGKPVAYLEAFLGSPNGAKDRLFEELLLKRLAAPHFCYEVDRDVDFQRSCWEVLKHTTHKKRNENKKVKIFLQYLMSTCGGPVGHRRHKPSSHSLPPRGGGKTRTPSKGWS